MSSNIDHFALDIAINNPALSDVKHNLCSGPSLVSCDVSEYLVNLPEKTIHEAMCSSLTFKNFAVDIHHSGVEAFVSFRRSDSKRSSAALTLNESSWCLLIERLNVSRVEFLNCPEVIQILHESPREVVKLSTEQTEYGRSTIIQAYLKMGSGLEKTGPCVKWRNYRDVISFVINKVPVIQQELKHVKSFDSLKHLLIQDLAYRILIYAYESRDKRLLNKGNPDKYQCQQILLLLFNGFAIHKDYSKIYQHLILKCGFDGRIYIEDMLEMLIDGIRGRYFKLLLSGLHK